MPRLFVGLDCPSPVRTWVARQAQNLERSGVAARWTHPDDFHITLRFLGSCSDSEAAVVERALTELRHPPVGCVLGGLGVFPAEDPAQAEILWLGAQPVAALKALKEAVDARLGPDPQGERGFHPHVTLARLKRVAGRSLGEALNAASAETAAWTALTLTLFASTERATGPRYQALARFPLR